MEDLFELFYELREWGRGERGTPGGRRSKLSKFPLGKFTMPIRR